MLLFYGFAFSMSDLSLQYCHSYSHLPGEIPIPGRPLPAPPPPHPDAQAVLVDQEQFGKSSERSLRADEGVSSQQLQVSENLEMSPARRGN